MNRGKLLNGSVARPFPLSLSRNGTVDVRDGKKWVCCKWKSSSKMETDVEVLVTGVKKV